MSGCRTLLLLGSNDLEQLLFGRREPGTQAHKTRLLNFNPHKSDFNIMISFAFSTKIVFAGKARISVVGTNYHPRFEERGRAGDAARQPICITESFYKSATPL